MKFKNITKLFIGIPLVALTSPLISFKIEKKDESNKIEEKNLKFLIESERKNINKITGKDNNLIFSKIISDLENRKILLLVFDDCNSFVDFETMQTLEINFEKYNLDILRKNEIFYISLGQLYFKQKLNDFIFINVLSNKKIRKEDITFSKAINILDSEIKNLKHKNFNVRSKIIKQNFKSNISYRSKGNDKEFIWPSAKWKDSRYLDVSTQVPYSWWFATRNWTDASGYDQLNNDGLCEYVALSQLLLYTELFIRPNIFDYDQYNNYILESNSNDLYKSSPLFRYHYYNTDSNKKSLAYDLFKLGGEYLNLKTGNYYEIIVNKFIKYKNVLNDLEFPHKFGGYYRAWQSVKNGTPAILGVATLSGFNHAMIVYGYDDDSNMFLASNCFGIPEENRILYSYYTKVWGSYYFSIKLKQDKKFNNFRKAFVYNGNKYTGKEIDNLLLNN
ncbi:hypothetical protein DMC14_002080 [Metamycoplasma phocicerebrale]|uniref:Uncharacterized protein n=1 Tax=Metamycoplasma phocicerebrale TaxID=142649 RepID=A0A3Q9V9I8_9BACT|nr:hypothetical protein [Metamycoplasma phocicerebrale]AZZ65564.1 hypothetical protein DMC14_002080 [Metamycoplasma phocicerebrale]